MMLILTLLFSLVSFAGEEFKSGNFTEVVDSPDGRYSFDFDASKQQVDLTRLDETTAKPAAVKVRIHRKNERPLDLTLRTLEKPNEPIHYTGKFDKWDGSVAGFEIDFSFDKKTWKKVKHFFGGNKGK